MDVTMPRRTASRARSLALQWLIGTPPSSGRSHANATMAQVCSGVMVAGAPERGASCNRSATVSPAPLASQRARHKLTPLRHTPSRWALSQTPTPSPASTIIRARSASCCGVEWLRTKRSSSLRSSALRLIAPDSRDMVLSLGFESPPKVNHQMPTAETPASRNFSRGVLAASHCPQGCNK
jgi:hypothetical protein